MRHAQGRRRSWGFGEGVRKGWCWGGAGGRGAQKKGEADKLFLLGAAKILEAPWRPWDCNGDWASAQGNFSQ